MNAIKQKDFKKCQMCNKGVMHTGLPLFYRVQIQRYKIDMGAVHRQAGLEMMLGGHATLANIMGPDADMATPMFDDVDVFICEACSTKNTMVAMLAETPDEDSGER